MIYTQEIVLILMDIDYSLDGTGFGTNFLLDTLDIGHIKTTGAEHHSYNGLSWTFMYNGLQMDLLSQNNGL